MSERILLADDDPDLLDVLSYVLRRRGFEVVTAADGVRALEAFERERPHLVILDVNMPGLDGFEVCQRIRARSAVPIIMLTVRNEDIDVVGALRLGADDYVTKPFSTTQLAARVEAALRRAARAGASVGSPATPHGGPEASAVPAVPAELGGLRLDLASHAAIWRGRAIPLDTVEYKLLDYLVAHVRAPVPSSKLIEHVWGDTGGSEELLRVYVRRLREHLEEDPDHPRVLRTVSAEPGFAYVLEPG